MVAVTRGFTAVASGRLDAPALSADSPEGGRDEVATEANAATGRRAPKDPGSPEFEHFLESERPGSAGISAPSRPVSNT